MNIRVFNLSHNVQDTELSKLFSAFGVVDSAEIVRNHLNGRSRGNAVIIMPIATEARQAITSLDQTVIDGKKISVSEFNSPAQW